jgi:hypothetical protein
MNTKYLKYLAALVLLFIILFLMNILSNTNENYNPTFKPNNYFLEYTGDIVDNSKNFKFKELETEKVIKTTELCIGSTCIKTEDLKFLTKLPKINDNEICLGQRCIHKADLERLNKFAKPGLVVAYNGDLNDLPVNWVLCNGNNGTPDLTDKFIMGIDEDSKLNETGGAEEIILKENNLPKQLTITVPPILSPEPNTTIMYQGCFKNEYGPNRKGSNGKGIPHIANQTWEQCKSKTLDSGSNFFGMEFHEGSPNSKQSQCLPLNKLSDMVRTLDNDCGAEIDGKRLGKAFRVAVYGIEPDTNEQINCAAHYNHNIPMDQSSDGPVASNVTCPESLPFCRGYRYNIQWGKCSNKADMTQFIRCQASHGGQRIDNRGTPEAKYVCPSHLPNCEGPAPRDDPYALGVCKPKREEQTSVNSSPQSQPKQFAKNPSSNVKPINIMPPYRSLYYIMMVE